MHAHKKEALCSGGGDLLAAEMGAVSVCVQLRGERYLLVVGRWRDGSG